MRQVAQRLLGHALRLTGLQYWPVRVRRGIPAGARWTLYPWSAYWRGGYEPDVEAAINGLGDLTGKVCWDLGAHFGFYSVGLALRTGPTGQVVAVEPFPSNFARLERHRRMNRLTWLKTFEGAVSDISGTADFFSDLGAGDTTVHLAYDGEQRTDKTPTIPVRTMRLDDLVARGEVRLPDFIKIDVEGHGHHALGGAMECIKRARPVILMGFHSPQEVSGTEALLVPLGYEFHPVGAKNPPDRVGADYLIRVSNVSTRR
jgi:FkbM family methyltransferase